jgi:hypothetical protein
VLGSIIGPNPDTAGLTYPTRRSIRPSRIPLCGSTPGFHVTGELNPLVRLWRLPRLLISLGVKTGPTPR